MRQIQRLFWVRVGFVFLLGFLFFPSLLEGRDWYVCAGKDGNGTKDSPLGTIYEALLMANPDDVIHVAEGVYYGEGESGVWVITKDDLTLVGGYSKDFSKRDPFKYLTVLMRKVSKGLSYNECKYRHHEKYHQLTPPLASYKVSPMIVGASSTNRSHSRTVLDGFVIDGHTRNYYHENGRLRLDKGPLYIPLITFSKPGCKIRNCVIFNSLGPAIRMSALGKRGKKATYNVIENCVIINTLEIALDLRLGNGVAVVENNTFFGVRRYRQPSYGLYLGGDGRFIIRRNIFYFSGEVAINNPHYNRNIRLIENVFWNHFQGVYRFYSSTSGVSIVSNKPEKLQGDRAKLVFSLSPKSRGNTLQDPELPVDPNFFISYVQELRNLGKGRIDWENVERTKERLGGQTLVSKKKPRFWDLYERDFIFLFSKKLKNIGAHRKKQYPSYRSKTQLVRKNYQKIRYSDLRGGLFQKIEALSKKNQGVDVAFVTELTRMRGGYYLPQISAEKYECFRAKNWLFLYVRKGTNSYFDILRAVRDRERIRVWGSVFDISPRIYNDKYVAVVVDKAEIEEEE
ncbi:MAG: DUF1565 domain-containing protein [Planctomycetota bacterium]|nr:MAG: DUF1565 domain-containing protein [Planctomycetota bacterium]